MSKIFGKKSVKVSKKETKNTEKVEKQLSLRQQKRQAKKELKERQSFKPQNGFTDPFGYQETDPYIFRGNRVFSVFDVLIQYGTNNPAPVGWMNMVIPRDQILHGDVMFVQRQMGMSKSTENEIIEKDLKSYAITLSNATSSSSRQETQNRMKVVDMRVAGELAGREDTIIDTDMRLIIKSKTPADIEMAIDELKVNYKNNDVKGVILVRRTGIQMQELETLLTTVSSDSWHNSDMSTVSAGRLFLPSSGFSDSTGVYVGNDVRSLLSRNPAIIDFSNVRNAVIFMGGVKPVAKATGGNYFQIANGGSAVAHIIADSNYLAGRRTHHIILSQDFAYRSPDRLTFDMNKEAINPFEVFGERETVDKDANMNFEKIVTMLSILAKETDNIMKVDLESMLREWFINTAGGSGMYTDDPINEPYKAWRILATDDHENYPKPIDFLTELTSYQARSSNVGERATERASYLRKVIKTAFDSYSNVFGSATTLPDSYPASARNIYYDLSTVGDDKHLLGAMLINTLAYVTNRALSNEIIVIHGLDSAELPPEALTSYRERIDRKGIGLITVYEKSENNIINPDTCRSFSGRLSKQDAVVLGGLTSEELNYINDSWQHPLPIQVSKQLLAGNEGILYFYRRRDRVGALIDTRLTL